MTSPLTPLTPHAAAFVNRQIIKNGGRASRAELLAWEKEANAKHARAPKAAARPSKPVAPKPPSAPARTSFTIDAHDQADLEREARVRGTTVSAIVRDAIASHLSELRREGEVENAARAMLEKAGHSAAARRVGKVR